jgi:hypothetical protein
MPRKKLKPVKIADTPDGRAEVVKLGWPRVRVRFPDGREAVYDVDDCGFPDE